MDIVTELPEHLSMPYVSITERPRSVSACIDFSDSEQYRRQVVTQVLPGVNGGSVVSYRRSNMGFRMVPGGRPVGAEVDATQVVDTTLPAADEPGAKGQGKGS